MKVHRILAISVCAAMTVGASPVFAKDPCASLLCMAGEVTGSGGGKSCSQPVSDFLSIIEYHHGHIDYNATPTAREAYLNSCPGSSQDTSSISSIISKFGSATHL